MYNLSNLEPKFKNFLFAEKISPLSIRNYLSDLRHFFGWLSSKKLLKIDFSLDDWIKSISKEIIEKYKNEHLVSALPKKTINRRLSALRKFFLFCQKEGLLDKNPAKSIANVSLLTKDKEPATQAKSIPDHFRQREDQKVKLTLRSEPKMPFLRAHMVKFLIIFVIFFSIFYFGNILKTRIYQIQPVTATQTNKRYLVFNGKLTDSLGNPITKKTDVVFRLYDSPEQGNILYTSSCIGQNGAINPDANGNIRVVIGLDCDGNPISSNLFSDNPNVYLGIAVSTDVEMKPREHIPNVGYAQNSDRLGGLTIGSEVSSVPIINQNGELLIGTINAGVRSTYESSNFTLSSAESITLQSANIGDVVLQATESGTIKLRTGGFSDIYTHLLINDQGNVGIGTLFPSYRLEVNGDTKIGDGGRLILGSSSADPVGINGSIYYNTLLQRIRCYQNGAWSNCVEASSNNNIGGYDDKISQNNENVYDGNPTQTTLDNLKLIFDIETSKLTSTVTSALDTISTLIKTTYVYTEDAVIDNSLLVKDIFSENIEALTSNIQHLTSNIISVREKINSPVIETRDIVATNTAQLNKISTNEIRPQGQDLIIELNNNQQSAIGSSDVEEADVTSAGRTAETDTVKGKLAEVILRGLEGKTVATIDAAGNASFSGQLTSNYLLVASDATVSGRLTAENISANQLSISENLLANEASLSGKLIAKEIEAENIASLRDEFKTQNSKLKTLDTNINDVQRLLAEIRDQPLSDPQYYQNLTNDQQFSPIGRLTFGQNNLTIEQLTVTGSSNLYNLSVTGSAIIGSLLIENNSILSLGWDLKLSSLSTIRLFDDAVVIAKDGTITTKGTLIAEGGIKTNRVNPLNPDDKVTINNLAINNLTIDNKYLGSASSSAVIAASDNFRQNGISSAAIETKTASAGQGIIPENSLEVIIYNDNVKESSLIYLTPTSPSPTTTLLTVVKKEHCEASMEQSNNEVMNQCKKYFKIAVDKPEVSPILFNWLIVN